MFGEELALGVVSNVLYGGLARVVGNVNVSIQRRHAIERSLSNPKDVKSQKFKNAINDLQTVVANVFGANTKKFDDFLNELSRSAFPEVLTETILNGVETTAAKRLFDAIILNYRDSPGFEHAPKNLFEAVETAVRAQYDMLSAESDLLSAIAVRTSTICTKVEALSKIADGISAFNKQRTLSKTRIDEIRIKAAKQIEAKHRYMTVETTRGARKYSISKLFIEPKFSRLNYEELSIPPQSRHKQQATRGDENSYRLNYSEFRNTIGRTVVLGDPGGGKSTTVQHICFEFARLIALAIEHPDRKGIDAGRQRIPFRVVLRAFETRKKQQNSLSILDYIIDELVELLDDARAETEEFIRYCLFSGTAIVLFDGLDEVLSVKTRREYVELIEQFTHTFPSVSVVITSRFVGYVDAALNPQYECLSLAELGAKEIEDYSRKSLAVIKGVKESSVERDVRSFLDQTSRNASDLRVNPLMLALMVWLYAIKGDVPANRPEIYKECATLMFEKWDQNRGILFGIPSDFELIDLFGFIAHEIFGKAELEEGVSKEWLFKKMKAYFSQWYEDRAKSVEVSKSLVEFLVGRAWVLSEIGQGVFKFTHRTFLEYFYAKYTNAQIDSVIDLVSKLRPRIIQGEMDVVNHLSLQMFTFREPRKMNQSVVALIGLITDKSLTHFEAGNALVFFARSLEYLVMPEMQYRNALETLANRVLEIGSVGETFVASAINFCVVHSGPRLDILRKVFGSVFKTATEQRPELHNFIINILSNGPLRRKNKSVYVTSLRLNPSKSNQQLMSELTRIALAKLEKLGETDIARARMAIELSPSLIGRYFQIYGHEILFTKLDTDAMIGRSAAVRVARALASRYRPLPHAPWISIDVDLLCEFLSNLLKTNGIKLPAETPLFQQSARFR